MKKSSRFALVILGIIIVSLLFLQTPVMSSVRGKAWSTWTTYVADFFNMGSLTVDNSVMEQIQDLRSNNIRLHAELKDYRRLRKQLGTPAFDDFKIVQAAVTARPVDTLRSQYVINKGTEDGITLDAPVVIHGSTMIGYIKELSQHSSVVQLLLHPETNLTVETVAAGKEDEDDSAVGRGLLQSRHYTSLLVTTIPRDVDLTVNQPVVTVAKKEQIPAGLTIGTVKEVYNAENEAYQEAWLALPYDPDKIDAVNVLVLP